MVSRWFEIGSSSKTKVEGRETLLGLMKVLGFCNSLFEEIFFFVFEKVRGSSIGKKLRLVELLDAILSDYC